MVGPEGRKHNYISQKHDVSEKTTLQITYREWGPYMIMVGTTLLVSDWTELEVLCYIMDVAGKTLKM